MNIKYFSINQIYRNLKSVQCVKYYGVIYSRVASCGLFRSTSYDNNCMDICFQKTNTNI